MNNLVVFLFPVIFVNSLYFSCTTLLWCGFFVILVNSLYSVRLPCYCCISCPYPVPYLVIVFEYFIIHMNNLVFLLSSDNCK